MIEYIPCTIDNDPWQEIGIYPEPVAGLVRVRCAGVGDAIKISADLTPGDARRFADALNRSADTAEGGKL